MGSFLTAVALGVAVAFSSAAVCWADDELDRANYHQNGIWGYTIIGDDEIAISGYYGSDTAVSVPEEIDGYTVTALSGGWFSSDDEVVLYGNVHSLEYDDDGNVTESQVYSPFSGNTEITSVTLPDTVRVVGAITFKDCTSLNTVNLGVNVEVIGNNCFENCTSLASINIPDTMGYVDNQAFLGCTSLTSVSLPVAEYDMAVFENCTALTDVVFAEGITEASPYMFSGCTALKNVTLGNADGTSDGTSSITEIGDSAFLGCTSLEQIILPTNLVAIYNNAFKDCSSLSYAYLGESLETLGSRAFANSGLTQLTVPDTLTNIGENAFGMSDEGEVNEDFTLICSEGTIAMSYADQYGISYSYSAQESYIVEDEAEDEVVDPTLILFLMILMLVIMALAIVIMLILTVKNRRLEKERLEQKKAAAKGSGKSRKKK